MISVLAGVQWGAHPSSLLALYKALFRGVMEYGCTIFRFQNSKVLFNKLLRIQYRILRKALGYRISTPINTILSESKEPPLHLRFWLCARRYLIKQLALNLNPVLDSYYVLFDYFPIRSRAYFSALHTIPTLNCFIKLISVCKGIFSSTLLPIFISKYGSIFYKPKIIFFKPLNLKSLNTQKISTQFLDFVNFNFNNVTSF